MRIYSSDTKLPGSAEVMPHSVFQAVASARDARLIHVDTDRDSVRPAGLLWVPLDGRWKRAPLEEGVDGAHPLLDDTGWPEIDVPDCYGADPALSRYFGPVWYRRKLRIPSPFSSDGSPRYFDLVFFGADYFCEVFLDGESLGEHEGYATPFHFDLSRTGPKEAVLAAKVRCPLEELDPSAFFIFHRKRQIKGTLSYHDSRPGGLPGASTPGWTPEEGQSYPTGGITGSVVLRATGPIRIDGIFVTPLDTKGLVHLAVVVTNRTDGPLVADLGLRVEPPGDALPETASVRLEAPPGPSRLDLEVQLESAILWSLQSGGTGADAALYMLEAHLVAEGRTSDARNIKFGIRTFDVEASPDAWRFHLNGSGVPLKGANYIPLQHFATATSRLYEADIELALRASLNSLGVHGHIQPEAFYEAADRAGILVFQDFSLQWTYDSGEAQNPGFKDRARRMAAEMVYRLWNHPSVVYWCSHNEPPYIWFRSRTAPEPEFDLDNQVLDREVTEAIRSIDPMRYVHQASGSGDSHRYEGSLSGGRLSDFCDSPAGFVSEYGFCSAAFSAARYGESEWPPDEASLARWAGRLSFFGSTSTYVGDPSRYACFQDWAYATQRYQAFVLKYMTEWMRSWRMRSLGGYRMHFFVDWNGYAGAGLLDRERRPKLAYDWFRRANSEVLAAALVRRTFLSWGEDESVELWAFSDSGKRVALDIEWTLSEAESFEIITSDPAAASLGGTGIAAPEGERVAIPRGPRRGRILDRGEAHFGLEPFGARRFGGMRLGAADAGVAEDGALPKALVIDLRFSWGSGTATNWGALAFAPAGWDAGPGMWPEPRFRLSVRMPGRGRGRRIRLYRRHLPLLPPREVETDGAGRAVFEELPPDEYDLEVDSAGRRVAVDLLEDLEVDLRF